MSRLLLRCRIKRTRPPRTRLLTSPVWKNWTLQWVRHFIRAVSLPGHIQGALVTELLPQFQLQLILAVCPCWQGALPLPHYPVWWSCRIASPTWAWHTRSWWTETFASKSPALQQTGKRKRSTGDFRWLVFPKSIRSLVSFLSCF